MEETGAAGAVNGFDVIKAQAKAPSQSQTAGVGVGFIFFLPAAEAGDEEHRGLEEEGEDVVLEADEEGKEVDEDAQEGNPDEETADEENGVVHQNDNLAEPGHAYAEEIGTGVAPLDVPHFMGHNAKQFFLRKLAEERCHDYDAFSQRKGIVLVSKAHIQPVVRGVKLSPAADFMETLRQEQGVFTIGLPPAFGVDEEALHHAQPGQNGRNEYGSQSQLHQKCAVIGT